MIVTEQHPASRAFTQVCCQLSVSCPSTTTVNLDCFEDLPAGPETENDFVLLGGTINSSCDPVEVTFSDADDNGAGCIGDTRTVSRTITVTDPGTMESHECQIDYIIAINTVPAEVGGPVSTMATVECLTDATAPTLPVIEDACGNVLSASIPVIG